jgi:hypothetical protein
MNRRIMMRWRAIKLMVSRATRTGYGGGGKEDDDDDGKGGKKESQEEVVEVSLILGSVSNFRSLKLHQIAMYVQTAL